MFAVPVQAGRGVPNDGQTDGSCRDIPGCHQQTAAHREART